MSKRSIDAIDGTKPYKGGTDELWILHRLDIIDKHRTLLAFGAGIPQGIALSRGYQTGRTRIDLLPIRPIYPLHVGQELFREPFDGKPEQDLFFVFQVVLNEPGIVEGKSILETLQCILDLGE